MPLVVMMALAMIDRAVQSGIELRSLRWRVSPAQRTAIVGLALAAREGATVSGFSFASLGHGAFCEIPYYVDENAAPDEIVLEQCMPEPVEVLGQLALPATYDRLQERKHQ
jgi:hypothetical protein